MVGIFILFKFLLLKSVFKCLLYFGFGFDIIVFVLVFNIFNY